MNLKNRKQRIDFFTEQFGYVQKDLDRLEVKAARELAKLYKQTFNEVKLRISELYEKHAVQGKLSRDELMKYNRLLEMQRSIAERLKSLGIENNEKNVNFILDAARMSYLRVRYGATEALGLKVATYGVNERVIEASLFNPLDKIGHQSRTLLNLGDSAIAVKDAVNKGIIEGFAYEDTAKLITQAGEEAFKRAVRIVRTEQHRAANVALEAAMTEAKEAGESLGIRIAKRWLTAHDPDVRDSHDYMDGQLADELGYFYSDTGAMTQYPGGFGLPEEDINCRCTMTQEIVSDDNNELNQAITVEPFEKWQKANGEAILYGR